MSESPTLGRAMPRKEDRRFLLGQGRYLDDLPIKDTFAVCFVRSPHAHARIRSIDTAAARALPGVAAVLTGADLAQDATVLRMAPGIPGVRPTEIAPMPVAKIRFVGDPVAVVVATDRYVAEDAAELVEVDYERPSHRRQPPPHRVPPWSMKPCRATASPRSASPNTARRICRSRPAASSAASIPAPST